ncbi:MAG: peroxiredoxin [Rhodoglobus sp.]
MAHDPGTLPADLPVPVDDGAARHLLGAKFPEMELQSTTGEKVTLSRLSTNSPIVLFIYPRTGRPGIDPPTGWDEIPGARGCTPEACSFRDLADEFRARGVVLFGLSTQDSAYQQEAVERLRLPYPLLSDEHLELLKTGNFPAFDVDGMTLFKRMTLVLREGRIARVLYPVFPPDRAADQALAAVTELLAESS